MSKITKIDFQNREIAEFTGGKNSKDFWHAIGKCRYKKQILDPIPIESWADYLQRLFMPQSETIATSENPVDPSSSERKHFGEGSLLSQANKILMKNISKAELNQSLVKLKGGKAPGPDGIPNQYLKTANNSLKLMLLSLFNEILKTQKVPLNWSEGKIQMIHKNGSPNSPENYCPITLLNSIPKLFSSIMANRLKFWQERVHMLPDEQAGFRPYRSCLDHIFTLNAIAQTQVYKNNNNAVFIDLAKAFDSINQNLLWKQLYKQGINSAFIDLLAKIYHSASISIIKNTKTKPVSVLKGVLQGDPLSPLLFNSYIYDIMDALNIPSCYPIKLHLTELNGLLFADDLVILAISKIQMQRKLEILNKYFSSLGLKINLSKTKCLIFRKGGRINKKDKLYIGNSRIENVKTYNYLGVPFSATRFLCLAQDSRYKKARVALNAIWPLLSKLEIQSMKTRSYLFNSLVKTIYRYASPVWSVFYKNSVEKLQNIFARRILWTGNLTPGYILRRELDLKPLEIDMWISCLKFWLHILNSHHNKLLQNAYLSLMVQPPTIKYNWCHMLRENWILGVIHFFG